MSFSRPQNSANSPVTGQPGLIPHSIVSMNSGLPHGGMGAPPSAPNGGVAPAQISQVHTPLASSAAPNNGAGNANPRSTAQSNLDKSAQQITPRFLELVEQLKAEFVNEALHRDPKKESNDPRVIQQHINDLTEIRKIIFELHQAHQQMREQYNSEVTKLRTRLDELTPSPPIVGRQEGDAEATSSNSSSTAANAAAEAPNATVSSPQNTSVRAPVEPDSAAPSTGVDVLKPIPAPLETAARHVPGPVVPPGEDEHQNKEIKEEETPSEREGAPGANSTPSVVLPTTGSPKPVQLNGAPETPHSPGTEQRTQAPSVDLAALNFEELPAQFKKEGSDYKVVYNPHIQRKLNIEQVHTLPHNSVVCCVRFSQDGKYLATGCNHIAQIYDVSTGKLCVRLHDTSADESKDLYIRSVCFSPDARFLATGAEDHKVRIWDIQKRELVHTLNGHSQEIYSLAYSNNGNKFLVSGSGDRFVKVWDTATGQILREFQIEDGVTAVALSTDDRYVAAGSLDRVIRIWDIETGELVERLGRVSEESHQDSVYSVAYMPNGRELISGSLDRTVKVWELGSNGNASHAKSTMCGPTNYVLSVAVSPDSKWIMAGSKDQTVHIWDSASGTVQVMLQAHTNSVISVAPSPDGKLFASGGGDSLAKVWRYDE